MAFQLCIGRETFPFGRVYIDIFISSFAIEDQEDNIVFEKKQVYFFLSKIAVLRN